MQSQKTQGFCVADFATLHDERRSRSKIFRLFIWIKEPCVRRSEGLERSKLLGISQTKWFGRRILLLKVSNTVLMPLLITVGLVRQQHDEAEFSYFS